MIQMVILIFFVFIAVAIIIFVIASSFDRDRIKMEVEARGGKLLSKAWSPFGKGWVGDEGNRIYKIVYRDKNGAIHNAFVKTSMFSGVYFSQDEITEHSENVHFKLDSSKSENEFLRLENEKLKKEIEKMKN